MELLEQKRLALLLLMQNKIDTLKDFPDVEETIYYELETLIQFDMLDAFLILVELKKKYDFEVFAKDSLIAYLCGLTNVVPSNIYYFKTVIVIVKNEEDKENISNALAEVYQVNEGRIKWKNRVAVSILTSAMLGTLSDCSLDFMIEQIKHDIQEHPEIFYRHYLVYHDKRYKNHAEYRIDNEKLSEVIAKILLEEDYLENIPPLAEFDPPSGNRDQVNILQSFDYYIKRTSKDNKLTIEAKIGQCMFTQQTVSRYQVIDYQVPVEGSQKVDLIIEDAEGEAILLEMKRFDSDESLLRAVIEIYTIYKRIGFSGYHIGVISGPASHAYQQFKDKKGNPYLIKLMKKLKVDFYRMDLIVNRFSIIKEPNL